MSDTTMILPKETAQYSTMNAADARAYIERWREVERVERLEAQAPSVQERWQQLNTLVGLAHALGLFSGAVEDQEEAVWQRWAILSRIGSHDRKHTIS
ncbi:MAG: hypothetical protein AUK03_06200 [Anaerolineae bacterium CG2_30_64_16]|nr:MAG: hypothetical protein AUK03_06200 [Anaerolineae bacterium CG2_30_64_16]